jgi:sugar transferase (PEP-CTERM system associated)
MTRPTVLERGTWRFLTLVGSESVLISAALGLGVYLRAGMYAHRDPALLSRIAAMTVVCQFFLYWRDLYDFKRLSAALGVLVRALQAVGATAIAFALLVLVRPSLMLGHGIFALAAALIVASVTVWRLAYQWLASRAPRERLLLVGTSAAAAELCAELRHRTHGAAAVVGVLTYDGTSAEALDVLGTMEDLPAIIRARSVDRVVVNLSDARGKLPMDKLLELRLDGVRFAHLASVYEEYTGRLAIEDLRPSWFIFSEGFAKGRLLVAAKRAMDLVGATLGLLLALPVMFVVMLLVRCTSRGPVLYRQRRIGQHGRVFTLRKFRSMREDAEAGTGAVWAGTHDDRVTPIGRFLRRSHLDELPQLWNILIGDMSLVGPRPERPEFVKDLTRTIAFYGQRHVVKPGLTGWAQVSYPYGASVDDSMRKLQYDLFYIKHLSIIGDVYVLLLTVKNVLQGRGV